MVVDSARVGSGGRKGYPVHSSTPLPVSLPQLTSLAGAVMPPQGNTKLIPVNTAVNIAPIAAEVGSIGGDYPSDKLFNGYTMSANVTMERQLPGAVIGLLTERGVSSQDEELYTEGLKRGGTLVVAAASEEEGFTASTTTALDAARILFPQGPIWRSPLDSATA